MLMAVLALVVVAGSVTGAVRALAGGPAVPAANRPGDVLLVPGYGGSTTALDGLAARIRTYGGRATRMRPRSWLAVSAGTLTGSALAITGNPQSRARPTATTAHLRTIWIFTKLLGGMILGGRSRAGRGGHVVYLAQTPHNGTITTRSPGRFGGAYKGGSRLSSGDLLSV
jgi:hypothetical protein